MLKRVRESLDRLRIASPDQHGFNRPNCAMGNGQIGGEQAGYNQQQRATVGA